MSEKYLIGEWVAFVQQVQFLVSRGYYEFHLVHYPVSKQQKFLKIDNKLITKYNANLNKDKAYYNKKKGYCNFKFLRHEALGILLKTDGNLNKNIMMDDKFINIKEEKIRIQIGETLVLLIGYDEKGAITVFMDKKTYRTVKVTCFQYIESKKFNRAIETFNALNALPSWGGIVSQKIKMKEQIIKKLTENLKKEEVYAKSLQLKINTKRTPVKVF